MVAAASNAATEDERPRGDAQRDSSARKKSLKNLKGRNSSDDLASPAGQQVITLTVGSAAPAKQGINAKLTSLPADDANHTDHQLNSERDSRELYDPIRIQVDVPGAGGNEQNT